MNTLLQRLKKRKQYPNDISNNGWDQLKKLIPCSKSNKEIGGRPAIPKREIINGIFYVVKTGCSWNCMPHDLPHHKTCYTYFHKWSRDGTWEMINTYFVRKVRKKIFGRKVRPGAAILDSQSCKSSSYTHSHLGFDNGKKIKGRKRFILTDTEGLLLAVWICAASISEKQGAMQLLRSIRMNPQLSKQLGRIKLIFADMAYQGESLWNYFKELLGWKIEVVKRKPGQKGWVVLKRRWVVERTFGWMSHSRRLARDYEKTRHSAKAMLYLAMLPIMLKKLN